MKDSTKINLKIPQPIVTPVLSGLMYVLDWFYGFKISSSSLNWLIVFLLSIACFLLFPAVAQFYKNKTTVNPLKPETSKVLVTGGVYYYSRNPMYLGMALVLLAWGVFLGNPFNIILFISFIVYMNELQIKLEEKALATIFGDEFKKYKNNVRRWI